MDLLFNLIMSLVLYWPYTLLVIIVLITLRLIYIAYKNKAFKRIKFLITFILLLGIVHWLFIGYAMVPVLSDDAEYEPEFFLKKYPTLQVEFRDFYLDLGDIPRFSTMSAERKSQISNYCFYYYGYPVANDQDIIACIHAIHPDTDIENPNG